MAHRMTKQLVLIHLVFFVSVAAQALAPEYYTVSDQKPPIQGASLDPVEAFSEIVKQARKASTLNLMSWLHHQEELRDPDVRYNRKNHYGTWVRDPNDGTCYNTRAKVLIRSSEVPVTLAAHGCAVVGGRWQDPYSNRQYTQASDIQIDHVVPLKNSYVSGGWRWDAQKRCLYANFLGNEYHLMAVNGPDNMRKGDRTPEKFMPPNNAYACEYLSIWLKIKLIWNLAMIPSEAQAISQLVMQNHCDSALMSMASQELSQQRQRILENMGLCRASQ